MANILWSTLTTGSTVAFNPATDVLVFDAGITSYAQLSNWDLQASLSIFTDLTGKTVTFSGLSTFSITPANVEFQGSAARFFIGDLTTGTAADDLPNNITGSSAADVIFGFGGNDTLNGGAGDDLIYAAGGGNDSVNGGDGVDWYMASTSTAFGMTANLKTGKAYYYDAGEVDTLTSIEAVRGTMHDDTLIGNDGDNFFRGRDGADFIFGGYGIDWALYNDSAATSGIVVDLESGVVSDDGFGNGEDLIGIENVRGSSYADDIRGHYGENFLRGDAGNDTLIGSGGYDTLMGGSGDDLLNGGYANGASDEDVYGYGGPIDEGNWVSYSDAVGGVTVNLTLSGAQNTVNAGTDTLLHIRSLYGSNYDDTLTGNTGKNALVGSAGNDSLFGDLGDDSLEGGEGDDLLTGGDGSDWAKYGAASSGVTVNLISTAAQNTVGAGTDTLISIENLLGSAFNDTLTGNTENNSLLGGAGDDSLTGGAGDDVLAGGEGNDSLEGGDGNDTASYELATSAVTVNLNTTTTQNTIGGGTDLLVSIEGVIGSDYADLLIGNSGNNTLEGGYGDDTFIGGAGDDVMDGGYSNFILNPETGQYEDTDILGNLVSYASASGGVTVDLSLNGPSQDIGGGQGFDTLNNISRLIGSAFDDHLTSYYSTSTIDAGAGNDRVVVQGGTSTYEPIVYTMIGGIGNDTVILYEYFNGFNGMALNLGITTEQPYSVVNTYQNGNGTLTTSESFGALIVDGFENVYGSSYADNITGTTGNNTIEGGLGDDTLNGGAGNDTVSYSNSEDRYIPEIYNPVTMMFEASGVTVSLALTTAQDTGSQGINSISGFENIIGSAGSDSLTGDGGNNILEGGLGKDSIDGGSGVDQASYSEKTTAVNVTLNGANFVNVTVGGVVEDSIRNIENVTGGSGNDVLVGDALANNLSSNAGNDDFRGAAGKDTLDGGAGIDRAWYTDKTTAVNVTLNGANLVNVSVGGVVEDSIRNIENITSGSGNDVLVGDALANSFTSNAGNDDFRGAGGNDTLDGGIGIDRAWYSDKTTTVNITLNGANFVNVSVGGVVEDSIRNIENITGGSGNDVLVGDALANSFTGNAGNDTLNGALGNDSLTGSAGNDHFVFSTALGSTNIDTLIDFQTGADKIVLDDDIFTALGIVGTPTGVALTASAFQLGASANDAGDRIIYNQTTGHLFYDADGSGAVAQQQIALIGVTTHAALTSGDFLVVA